MGTLILGPYLGRNMWTYPYHEVNQLLFHLVWYFLACFCQVHTQLSERGCRVQLMTKIPANWLFQDSASYITQLQKSNWQWPEGFLFQVIWLSNVPNFFVTLPSQCNKSKNTPSSEDLENASMESILYFTSQILFLSQGCPMYLYSPPF